MKLIKNLVILITSAVMLTGCYKSYVDDSTPAPNPTLSTDSTEVSLTVEWDMLLPGDVEPNPYTLLHDGEVMTMTTNSYSELLPSGENQKFLAFNNPLGIEINSLGIATLSNATRTSTDIEMQPGRLYYGYATTDLMPNTPKSQTISTKLGTIPLIFLLGYDMADVVHAKSIVATLSGVAATRNLYNDAVKDEIMFTTDITLDDTKSEYELMFNLLGVIGDKQVISIKIEDQNGRFNTISLDITDLLMDFNSQTEPVVIPIDITIPEANWLLTDFTSTNYPAGTDWFIQTSEYPIMGAFDSIRNVLKNIVDPGTINLTLAGVKALPEGYGEIYGRWSGFFGAFFESVGLKSITMEDVTVIGENAFGRCTGLTTVYAPKAAKIGMATFSGCAKLTNFTLDFDALTEIPQNAFFSCEALTSIDFPNVTYIDDQAFRHCDALSDIDLPKLTVLDRYGIANCPSLVSINLPEITEVDGQSMTDNEKLETITLGKATKIESSILSGCASLRTIYIGTNLTAIPTADEIDIAYESGTAFDGLTLGNIDLYVTYGTASGEAGNMTWTVKPGAELTGFKSVTIVPIS